MWTLVILTAINLGTGDGWKIESDTRPTQYASARECAAAYERERWQLSGEKIRAAGDDKPS